MRDHKSLLAWQEAHAVVVVLFRQFARSRRFRNHLDVAYGSAVETAELLELSAELSLLSNELIASALQRYRHCQRLLRGLINHLRIP